jgi:O-antigen/teichoic acid export membrane protein
LSASTKAGYGRGAAILSVGIGVTGLVTYTYFSLSSYALSESEYGRITLLWSAMFIVVSILYRPVEQLLSRTIADRDARGITGNEHLRVAATIQLGLGVLFAVLALIFHDPIENDLFDGSETLYWVLIVGVLAYAASYFARGFLAGHHRFGLYGLLVLMEATSRCLFAVLAVIGVAEGQSFVALGMAAAPIVSLMVVPWALGRRLHRQSSVVSRQSSEGVQREELGEPRADEPEFTLSHGTGFAAAVLLIMVSEQTFLNAGPLLVNATAADNGAALAGFAFNVLLIARAPLQLFQAVQTSILPHLTKLRASGDADPFHRSIQVTLMAIAGFAGSVALVMLLAGPWLMGIFFGGDFDYDRGGLVLVAIGMGLYLSAATLNQAALARARGKEAAACWVATALLFVAFLLVAGFDDEVLEVEVAFTGAALLLSSLLYALYRAGEAQPVARTSSQAGR